MARPSFAKLAHQPPKAEPPQPTPAPSASPVTAEEQPMLPMRAPLVQRSRQGKKTIAGYFEPEFAKAIKTLGVELDRTTESLMREALNDLLRKNGKHPFGDVRE